MGQLRFSFPDALEPAWPIAAPHQKGTRSGSFPQTNFVLQTPLPGDGSPGTLPLAMQGSSLRGAGWFRLVSMNPEGRARSARHGIQHSTVLHQRRQQ
jgi:hypothetical protein